jgi:hypothetical protein
MDRGEFAARMLGFIFIPATLPEYHRDQVHAHAMGAAEGSELIE